jgi:hypothetical protein
MGVFFVQDVPAKRIGMDIVTEMRGNGFAADCARADPVSPVIPT